jgi:CheY-like chemotaxis protein
MTVRVLMVDDEPDAEVMFRQNFRREIRAAEYHFLFARSGDGALDLLNTVEAPGLLVVLSDINMPGMSGLALLKEIKERQPDLPVIMITAYGDMCTETVARESGAEAFLCKPVNFATLKATLAVVRASRAP